MSKTIERLALAISDNVSCDYCRVPLPPDCCCFDAARAVIAAMGEPAPEMNDDECEFLAGKLIIPFADGEKALEELSNAALLAIIRMLWNEREMNRTPGRLSRYAIKQPYIECGPYIKYKD